VFCLSDEENKDIFILLEEKVPICFAGIKKVLTFAAH